MTGAAFSALAAAAGIAIAAMIRHARFQRSTGLRGTGLRGGAVVLALAVIGVCWFLHDSGGIAAGVVFVVVLVGAQLLPSYPQEARSDSAVDSQ